MKKTLITAVILSAILAGCGSAPIDDTTAAIETTTATVIAPEPETTMPVPETTVPVPETTAPEPETTVPEPETTAPVPETTVPEPETTVPVPETTVPVPETTAPEPETTAPVPETTAPEPETTAPVPETTAPEPETTVPEPETTVPDEVEPHTHNYARTSITKRPTHTEAGVRTKYCECGLSVNEVISPNYNDHKYGEKIYLDESNHKQECECGKIIRSPHVFNIYVGPSEEVEGDTYSCECGHTETISLSDHCYLYYHYSAKMIVGDEESVVYAPSPEELEKHIESCGGTRIDPIQNDTVKTSKYKGKTWELRGKTYYYEGSFLEEVTIAKPVLYLYPEAETEVTVTFDNPDRLTTVYPAYNGAWNVTAKPDGTLTDAKGRTYYALYWEEDSGTPIYRFTDGFCVKGEDSAAFLEDALARLGFTEREANEFIIYWLPIMERNEYNLIRFELTDEREAASGLSIYPKPDSLLRMAMHIKAADAPVDITEQELPAFERRGFVAVEWGGCVH